MSKQVTLTIDGKQVAAPEGTGLVDAAKMVGIDIPVFCHHPKLEPVGMCRMCLVEIGRPVRDRTIARRYAPYGSFAGLALWCDMTRGWFEAGEIA